MDSTTKLKERHSGDGFIEDDECAVHRLGEFGKFVAESLVDAAADAIAADGGFEDFFRDDNGETLVTASVGSKN